MNMCGDPSIDKNGYKVGEFGSTLSFWESRFFATKQRKPWKELRQSLFTTCASLHPDVNERFNAIWTRVQLPDNSTLGQWTKNIHNGFMWWNITDDLLNIFRFIEQIARDLDRVEEKRHWNSNKKME